MKNIMDLIKGMKKERVTTPAKRTRAAKIEIKHKGKMVSLAKIAADAKLEYMTVYMRYRAGARDFKVLTRPTA